MSSEEYMDFGEEIARDKHRDYVSNLEDENEELKKCLNGILDNEGYRGTFNAGELLEWKRKADKLLGGE